MPKLLMVTGLGSVKDLVSGKRGAFYSTLEEFHKYWDRIDIISPKINGHESGVMELFGNVYIHISPWPLVFHPFWFLKKGLQIYKEQKFDLMTVQEYPPFYNGIGARLLWGKINPHTHFGQFLGNILFPWYKSEVSVGVKVPYVMEIHHIPGYPRAANKKEEIYRSMMKVAIEWDSKHAKAVRVVNQSQVPKFLIESGVPKDKIIYIPSLYIDFEVFKPMNLTKEYDLIFVGRLEANKGINLLLEAIRNLKNQIPNIKCLIVGNGSLFNHCKLEIVNWKLEDNVRLYGWAKDQKEIAELINKSKILVMSSYNEGGPRVVLEAMACGVPVLATPVGIVPDLLKNASGGEIVGWDAEDIATRAGRLLGNESERQVHGRAAVELAKKFEKTASIKNYADKLKFLI